MAPKRERAESEIPEEDAVEGLQTNKDGEKYLQVSKNRRISIRSFKGTPFIDIREYYTKDDELLPGKKGITLNAEAWATLLKNKDLIDDAFTQLRATASPQKTKKAKKEYKSEDFVVNDDVED